MLDSGDGVTHAVPVFEGFSMPHAIQRIDVAGRDVTESLQVHLRKAGYHLQTSAEKEVVRMIKEKCCYVALNPVKEEAALGASHETEEFKLPDGNTVKVSAVFWLICLTTQVPAERRSRIVRLPVSLVHATNSSARSASARRRSCSTRS